MEHSNPTPTDEPRRPGTRLLREAIADATGSAFLIAGLILLASLVVPIGLSAVTDLAWTAGLGLVALAVLAAAAGVTGLSLRLDRRAPLARTGALAAAAAATVAVGLLVAVGLVVAGVSVRAIAGSDPMGTFRWVALAMAGGTALGFLLVGVASRRQPTAPRRVGPLLALGGVGLLIPGLVELAGPLVGTTTPAWLLFAVIGLVVTVSLAVGRALRAGAAG